MYIYIYAIIKHLHRSSSVKEETEFKHILHVEFCKRGDWTEAHPAGFVPHSSSGQTAWWTQGGPVRDELSGSCWPRHTPLTHLHGVWIGGKWSFHYILCTWFWMTQNGLCLSILQKVYLSVHSSEGLQHKSPSNEWTLLTAEHVCTHIAQPVHSNGPHMRTTDLLNSSTYSNTFLILSHTSAYPFI